MSPATNRRIVYTQRPDGLPSDACWKLVDGEALPPLTEGQVRVEVSFLSIDPAMRAWLDVETHDFSAKLGETMLALGVGKVVESQADGFAPGDTVSAPLGVQRFVTLPAVLLHKVDVERAPASAYLGALGLTAGVTAWVGMIPVGGVQSKDTVVVSAAAGAVGSIAGQIARIHGARVIGIAGGAEKVRHVVEDLGFDSCIDYKSEDVHTSLTKLAPDGVDLYFDNVGGEMLDAVLDQIRQRARVVICGAISQYQHREDVRGPKLYLRLAERNAQMLGFSVDRWGSSYGEAESQLAGWLSDGSLQVREHVEHGIENFPATLLKLFDGGHIGKLLLAP